MNNFLLRLPPLLERLELSNCLEITSNMITKYLIASGANLRELVLNNNPALNLSFLQTLAMNTPQLQHLQVDMRYYSERLVTNDAEAFYDEVLSAEEVPTWPRTLRSLSIVHAQKWSADGAQNLFRSLIASAPHLPDLRSLILHTHINIPWRDRVSFREQWTERLRRVYERKQQNPSAHMGSLRQIRLWDAAHARLNGTESKTYVRVSPHKPSGDTDAYSDSEPAAASSSHAPNPQRRSARVATTAHSASASPAQASESESESEEAAEDGDGDDWRRQPEPFVQGLCNVVDVRIDNQRPREEQFTEGDFLDSEQSGDEDYREGGEEGWESGDGDGERYAW